MGFLVLTLIPGFLVVQILKINEIRALQRLLFTIGISISFLMFYGLIINNLSLFFGYDSPLSTFSLLSWIDAALIILTIVSFIRNRESVFNIPKISLKNSDKIVFSVAFILIALSISGTYLMNTWNNNILILILFLSIAFYVIFICMFNREISNNYYPAVIYSISISLLLLLALKSTYVMGSDSHSEFYFFQTTFNNLHWSILNISDLDACLSISILPSIFQSLLSVNPEILFNLLYPLIFSISPFVVFIISNRYLNKSYSFLAACFFMFQTSFIFTAMNARTSLAILFFGLAILTLFTKFNDMKKSIIFIILFSSCIVSHYSTSFIFFFILLGTVMINEIISLRIKTEDKNSKTKINFTKRKISKTKISFTVVLLFFCILFLWYSQLTGQAFDSGVNFIVKSLHTMNNIFVQESKSDTAQLVVGTGIFSKSIASKIQYFFTWLTFLFIGIGILNLLKNFFLNSLLKHPKHIEMTELKEYFDRTFTIIAIICSLLLISMILIPFLSKGYSVDRLYGAVLIILSTYFVFGGIILSKWLLSFINYLKKLFKKDLKGNISHSPKKVNKLTHTLILAVLIPYFLFISGFGYVIVGTPQTMILNSNNQQYENLKTYDSEIYGAKWLKINADNTKRIYADKYGTTRLFSGGLIPKTYYAYPLIDYNKSIFNGYLYLRWLNTNELKIEDQKSVYHNLTDYQSILEKGNKLYDSGGAEVWNWIK
jgi:uncharacterized membrane protein